MTIIKWLQNKQLQTFIKIIVSVVCLLVLFNKIHFSSISFYLRNSDPFYLALACTFFLISKIFSAVRLQKYLHSIQISIPLKENIKLYWLSMFYNLFLPGGIGGDGYKAYYLNKQFTAVSLKKIIITLLKDRLNGLIIMSVLMINLSFFLPFKIPHQNILLVSTNIFLIISLYLIEKFLTPSTLDNIKYTSLYSLLIQITQLGSMLFILLSLGIHQNLPALLFVFLLSTIIVMIPITIGGMGLRELTFLYLAEYLRYNENESISAAFLFFLISSLSSLPGIYYHFRTDKIKNS